VDWIKIFYFSKFKKERNSTEFIRELNSNDKPEFYKSLTSLNAGVKILHKNEEDYEYVIHDDNESISSDEDWILNFF